LEISTKKLTKKFEDKTALSNITMKVDSGKVMAIIGPSGSGKTTLLRLLNLLDNPSSGQIMINGKNPERLTSKEVYDLSTRMALVFQNPSLFQRSVEANVGFPLKIRLVHPEKIKERVNKALELVRLKDMKDQFAPTLSAGEAQRASFARAIVYKPKLLMLDEFTANLDPANVKMLEEAVTKYNKETKASIILATHNLFQAKRLADKIIFIYDGKIVESAEKNDFFANPKEDLTKAFLSGELIC
jgi:tungstate transport system ATP-binding protein